MAAMCTPARSWLTAFIADPAPGSGPSSKTVSAMASRTGRAAAKASGAARGHHRERPRRGLDRPARDRRVEVEDARLGALRRHPPGEGGRDRGAGDDDGARAEASAPPRRRRRAPPRSARRSARRRRRASSSPATSASLARRAALGPEALHLAGRHVEAERRRCPARRSERADAVAHRSEAEHGGADAALHPLLLLRRVTPSHASGLSHPTGPDAVPIIARVALPAAPARAP